MHEEQRRFSGGCASTLKSLGYHNKAIIQTPENNTKSKGLSRMVPSEGARKLLESLIVNGSEFFLRHLLIVVESLVLRVAVLHILRSSRASIVPTLLLTLFRKVPKVATLATTYLVVPSLFIPPHLIVLCPPPHFSSTLGMSRSSF
jgi:hypothetical protein